jgi:hypothetical protein
VASAEPGGLEKLFGVPLDMLDRLNNSMWKKVFDVSVTHLNLVAGWKGDMSPFSRELVTWILGISDGQPNGKPWIGLFTIEGEPKRYVFVTAKCDALGSWTGHSLVGGNWASMGRFALGDEERNRLNLNMCSSFPPPPPEVPVY